jgi:pimeloyl-ACP methyl ester carboxylesterase
MKSAMSAFIVVTMTAAALAQSVEIGPPPGKLVDIGGRKLHVNCTGDGAPTVILEAGASAFAIDWSLVQPEIAKTNRTCAYDRAGLGWSDAGGSKGVGVVTDLHAALQAAAERPPYVLVGASMGGIYVRLYEARYPNDVLGMVMVDPAHEDRLFAMFQGKPVEIASLTAEQYRSTYSTGPIRVPRRAPQTGAPFDRLPPDLYKVRVELERRAIAAIPDVVPYETAVKSGEEERAALAELRELGTKQDHPLEDRPLVILTRGDAEQSLKESRERLARISTNARHSVIAGAGHEIHLFAPDTVIQAIQDVLNAVKSNGRLPPR